MSLDPEDYPRTGVVLTITAGILLVVDAALYGVARAQLPASEIDFSRQLPRIRSFEPVEEPAGDVLPAIAPDTDQLAAGARVFAGSRGACRRARPGVSASPGPT